MRTILLLLSVAAGSPAMAQTPAAPPAGGPTRLGPMRGAMLTRADANGDGAISRAEAIAAADTRFDWLDADRDGTVVPEEFRAARDAMRGRGGDGPRRAPPPMDAVRPAPSAPVGMAMTREQSRTRALAVFARADANGDGTVDQAEIASLRMSRAPGRRGDRPGADMPPLPPQD